MIEHFNHLYVCVCVLFWTINDEYTAYIWGSVPKSIFLPYLVFNQRLRLLRITHQKIIRIYIRFGNLLFGIVYDWPVQIDIYVFGKCVVVMMLFSSFSESQNRIRCTHSLRSVDRSFPIERHNTKVSSDFTDFHLCSTGMSLVCCLYTRSKAMDAAQCTIVWIRKWWPYNFIAYTHTHMHRFYSIYFTLAVFYCIRKFNRCAL